MKKWREYCKSPVSSKVTQTQLDATSTVLSVYSFPFTKWSFAFWIISVNQKGWTPLYSTFVPGGGKLGSGGAFSNMAGRSNFIVVGFFHQIPPTNYCIAPFIGSGSCRSFVGFVSITRRMKSFTMHFTVSQSQYRSWTALWSKVTSSFVISAYSVPTTVGLHTDDRWI